MTKRPDYTDIRTWLHWHKDLMTLTQRPNDTDKTRLHWHKDLTTLTQTPDDTDTKTWRHWHTDLTTLTQRPDYTDTMTWLHWHRDLTTLSQRPNDTDKTWRHWQDLTTLTRLDHTDKTWRHWQDLTTLTLFSLATILSGWQGSKLTLTLAVLKTPTQRDSPHCQRLDKADKQRVLPSTNRNKDIIPLSEAGKNHSMYLKTNQ